jgi:two-component system, NarL family, sensor histidine kinase DesK
MPMRKFSFRLFPERFGLIPLMWLLYLILPTYGLFHAPPFYKGVGLFLLLLFVIAYRQVYWGGRYFPYWLGCMLGIILFFGLFYASEFIMMGFFPPFFIAWYRGRKFFTWYAVFVAVVFFIVGYDFMTNGFTFIKNYILYLVVMLVMPVAFKSLNEKEEQLKAANEKIEELVKQQERHRIARDLHDTLGHSFSFITLKSQLIERFIEKDPKRAKEEIKEIEQTSRRALQQVREIISNMKVTTVDEAIAEAKQMLKIAGISFTVDVDTVDFIPKLHQNVLSLCIKEAVTNVVKHSRATACELTLRLEKGSVQVQVSDNGIGFSRKSWTGNGLNGIQERLRFLDGEMHIHSDKGTTLIFTLPIIEKATSVNH